MGFFSSSSPNIDPRAPFAVVDDLAALFKVSPLLKLISFVSHWNGWHDERPPSNPRMIFYASAEVGKTSVDSQQGIEMAQMVDRILIDRGLMMEPDEGYNWNGRNTLLSTWKRSDVVKAFDREAKAPLGDPARLALLQAQALCERLQVINFKRETFEDRQKSMIQILNDLASVPNVPVEIPNAPSSSFLHLRRELHAVRGNPLLERLDARSAKEEIEGDEQAPLASPRRPKPGR